MKTIYEYIEDYIEDSFEIGDKSIKTKLSYQGKLKEFAEILEEIKGKNFDTTTLCFEDIREYVKRLSKRNSASSVSNKFIVVKIFLKYLKKRKVIKGDITIDEDGDKIKLPKVNNKKPKFLTEEECFELIKKLQWKESGYNPFDGEFVTIRNQFLILTMIYSGLRRAEILHFTWNDIYNDTITIKGKGGKIRQIPLAPIMKDVLSAWKEILNKYIEKSPNKDKYFKHNLVFPSNRGTPMTEGNYWQIIEKALELIGRGKYLIDDNGNYILDKDGKKVLNPNNVSGHSIRKTFASLMLKNGVNLRVIQELLGHSNIVVTERYLGVSEQDKQKAVNTINIDFNIDKK